MAMSSSGIAWESDLKRKFKDTPCPPNNYCWLSKRNINGTPAGQVGGLTTGHTNVDNEHFVVWMRNAALPTFRKLYGVIDRNLKKGEKL